MMKRSALFLVVLCAALLAFGGNAFAATYVVNDLGDANDASPGDHACNTAGNVCTLRAAVQQSNTDGPGNTIEFGFGVTGQTIVLSTSMSVGQQMTIDGCNGAMGTIPCVGLNTTGNNGLTLSAAVNVSGLAIRSTGNEGSLLRIPTIGANSHVARDWIGMGLDGTTNAGTVTDGILVEGSGATIGGTTDQTRNVINGVGTGIHISGADGTTVQGNYFSTNAAGANAQQNGHAIVPNGTDIGIEANGVDMPEDTLIGGPFYDDGGACDGGCNLISGATVYGIDLSGEDTGNTVVAGNYVGTDLAGSGTYENGNIGIYVGASANVTIGGATTADRNVVAGNGTTTRGIYTDPNSSDLLVQNNFLGLNATGTAARPFNFDTAVIQGAPSGPPVFRDNRVAASGGSKALTLQNTGAQVLGNTLGIATNGQPLDGGGIGGSAYSDALIDGNVIGNTGTNPAITISGGDDNVVTSNKIGVGADGTTEQGPIGAGIFINDSFGSNGAMNNVIGGATEADGNVIANTTDDAVAIQGTGTGNRFLSGSGFNIGTPGGVGSPDPGDLFIDVGGNTLSGDGVGATANGSVLTPTVTSADSGSASGTALPSAVRVHVFQSTTATGDPRQISAGLGATTSVAGGAWSLGYDPIADSSFVTALAEDPVTHSTGELSTVTDVAADTTAPDTTITSGPAGAIAFGGLAQFTFSSEPHATFACAVDSGPFTPCASPFTSAALATGSHSFAVRATDINGNVDPSPATRAFSVSAAPTAIAAPVFSVKLKGKATIKKGATLTVTVDKASTLSVKLTQKTKHGKKTKTKTKTVSLGSLKAGSNTVKLKLSGFKAGKIAAVFAAADRGVASAKTLSIKAKKK